MGTEELTQARLDAKQLVTMTPNQLSQPAAKTLLNDLYQQVNQAYIGQMDPLRGEMQGGAEHISALLQHLATIEIKPYGQ